MTCPPVNAWCNEHLRHCLRLQQWIEKRIIHIQIPGQIRPHKSLRNKHRKNSRVVFERLDVQHRRQPAATCRRYRRHDGDFLVPVERVGCAVVEGIEVDQAIEGEDEPDGNKIFEDFER
ncbi:hypothetical protein ACO22_01667 [Paracoccidioides brasiliensis]|uniref:Uncharacterized protein n=1 Tax=Paracoccidioides brasiliensis TaxID=121759 RepID=A0A1D2JKX2_PARBR|nr:hypothetical protein ACO22_01667 [Paracoccidioides brasiliensis]